MANRVFFTFHYQDVIDFRANVVRNHWLTKPDREAAGFYDASIWETARKQGDIALKRLINDGLENTTNTCVLIGSSTYSRPWVRYEILKSFKRGNHLFGVHINSIKGKDGLTKTSGPNPTRPPSPRLVTFCPSLGVALLRSLTACLAQMADEQHNCDDYCCDCKDTDDCDPHGFLSHETISPQSGH
jgi:hypothetical protein